MTKESALDKFVTMKRISQKRGPVDVMVTRWEWEEDVELARATVTISVEQFVPPDWDDDWLIDDAIRDAVEVLRPAPRRGRPPGVKNSRRTATCEQCGTTFSAGRWGTRFCSGRCRSAAHRAGLSRPTPTEIPPEVLAEMIATDRRLSRAAGH